MKVSPERLIPGTTIAQVEAEYKKRRDVAMKKKRQALVAALDKAIIVRRKQLGGTSSSLQLQKGKKGPLVSKDTDFSKISPERLIPGSTIQQVEAEYKKRRARAVQKKRQALVAALDKAIIARRQQLKGALTQPQKGKKFSSLSKVPPEVLIPGKTPGNVEREYKKRREGAVRKGRTEYVAALNKAIGPRRQQI
jgi:UDP-N-acetyl-D-mannosaminuronate dehydrogenase